jgi:hypothetical protein
MRSLLFIKLQNFHDIIGFSIWMTIFNRRQEKCVIVIHFYEEYVIFISFL